MPLVPLTISVPLLLSGKPLATVVAGPVFCGTPAAFTNFLRAHKQTGGNGEFDTLPVITPPQRDGVQQLLESFVTTLAPLLNQHLLAAHPAESPCVTRARDYIREHAHEPLHVAAIARHVHFCTDHFVRLFKKSTGFTIKEYITRVRLQRAQELLADPHCRVVEAAFAAGFQSLPTFNRAFKLFTGQSPNVWRVCAAGPFKSPSRILRRESR